MCWGFILWSSLESEEYSCRTAHLAAGEAWVAPLSFLRNRQRGEMQTYWARVVFILKHEDYSLCSSFLMRRERLIIKIHLIHNLKNLFYMILYYFLIPSLKKIFAFIRQMFSRHFAWEQFLNRLHSNNLYFLCNYHFQ